MKKHPLLLGVPCKNTIELVDDSHPPSLELLVACIKSPKSTAFPVDAMVTKSITICISADDAPPNSMLFHDFH